MRHRSRTWSAADRDRVEALLAEGLTVREVASRTGVPVGTVGRWGGGEKPAVPLTVEEIERRAQRAAARRAGMARETRLTAEALDERDRAVALVRHLPVSRQRNIALLGDPLPGRSALDRRNSRDN